jgi:hypothetical protein
MGKAKRTDDCDPEDDRISFLWKENNFLALAGRTRHTQGGLGFLVVIHWKP